MAEFTPTWLYIKQHVDTGLKYFGKTTRKDPIKYLGSGVRWTHHLNKHGKNITTTWAQLFNDKESLVKYATVFSIENNIVESAEWANLKAEDGLMGGNHNRFTPEGRKTLSKKGKNHRHTEETKNKLSLYRKNQVDPRLGRLHTDESKNKIKEARKLQIISEETKHKISESLKLKWAERKALKETTQWHVQNQL